MQREERLAGAPARREQGQRLVMAVFANRELARAAFERLVEASFDPQEISVLLLDHGEAHVAEVDHKTGVSAGVTLGASLGGALGLAVALGGPVGLGLFAAGPLLAALQGAVAGAGGGGLLGALAGLAFWWDEPELEGELARGGILLGVAAAGERAELACRELRNSGANRVRG